MSTTLRRLGFALLVLAAGTPATRGADTTDPRVFNDAIVGFNSRLTTAGQRFGNAVQAAIGGNPADVTKLREEYQGVQKTLAKVNADMQTLKVPDSPAAHRFYEAEQRFLKYQERLVQEDLAAIIKVVEDPNVGKDEKASRVKELIGEIVQDEASELAPLRRAQVKFAKAHNIKLN